MPGMTEPYLREKFALAVNGLAAGAGLIAERVRDAMVILIMFGPEDMPDKWSQEEFARVRYIATDRQATGDEGDLAATLTQMKTEDVQDLARSIVLIWDHLLRRTDPAYAADQEPA